MREPRYSILSDINDGIDRAKQGKLALYWQRNIEHEYRCKKVTPAEQQAYTDLQDILADVMLSARQEESRKLAGDIQRLSIFRLKKRGFVVKNNGARSAPFHVLLGANMPAVLVELGYCTNPAEAGRLLQAKYRLALAEGIAEGILAYKNRLQKRRTAENALTGKGADAM